MSKCAVAIMIVGAVDRAVTLTELRSFVEEAVSSWGGQRHLDDPLSDSIEVHSVRTTRVGDL
jgi:hypothetical protein